VLKPQIAGEQQSIWETKYSRKAPYLWWATFVELKARCLMEDSTNAIVYAICYCICSLRIY